MHNYKEMQLWSLRLQERQSIIVRTLETCIPKEMCKLKKLTNDIVVLEQVML